MLLPSLVRVSKDAQRLLSGMRNTRLCPLSSLLCIVSKSPTSSAPMLLTALSATSCALSSFFSAEVNGSSTNLPTFAASLMQSRNSTTNSFSPDFTVRCKKSSCPSKAATSLSKLFAPPDEPPKIFFKKSIIFDISLVCVFQLKIFTFFVNLLSVMMI